VTRILLIGATGQLGSELARLLAGPALTAVGVDRPAPWRDGLRRYLDERGEPASQR
jgi:dTDP-4-dehydrorhamnose reductase